MQYILFWLSLFKTSEVTKNFEIVNDNLKILAKNFSRNGLLRNPHAHYINRSRKLLMTALDEDFTIEKGEAALKKFIDGYYHKKYDAILQQAERFEQAFSTWKKNKDQLDAFFLHGKII